MKEEILSNQPKSKKNLTPTIFCCRSDASSLRQTLDDELKEGAKEEDSKNLKRMHDDDDDEEDDDDDAEYDDDDEDSKPTGPVKLNALKGMDLKQFEIKGSDTQWSKAIKKGKKVGVVSVKGSDGGGGKGGDAKKKTDSTEGGKKDKKQLLKTNKKKRKFIEK